MATPVDNFRKEAKRWLKALRAGDAAARARLNRAYPAAPAEPGLRDVQHALAREHGHRDWIALTSASAAATPPMPPAEDKASRNERAALFLRHACWDHHTHGKADHRMYDRAAQRLLAQDPALARQDLYTAIVCGDLPEVRRRIDQNPASAREAGGARGWTPLLYLCYTRFTHQPTIDAALDIARLLLDRGANPNDFYMAGDSEYSALVGAAAEGEQDAPRQPYAEALYALLLERGAGPYDIQVLYDTHFSGDMIWWLDLTYRHALRTGRKADWEDPDWSMLDMGGYGSGAYFILNTAVDRNNLDLAAWALERGASPNSNSSASPSFRPKHSLYDSALAKGLQPMADLLLRYGAAPAQTKLDPESAFLIACMRVDRAGAQALVHAHPELRQSRGALFEAARRNRPDVIALLLDLGVPLEIEDEHHVRALHHAAVANALDAARFLLDRGAAVDPRETRYGATPIGWAAHADRVEMLDFLSRRSRNIWTLAFRGYVDRVRELLRDDPALARQASEDGITPLWWLPDDDQKAMEIVDLLLAAGADPARRSRGGGTAAAWARERGMTAVARRLEEAAGGTEPDRGPVVEPLPEPLEGAARYEGLASDLVAAYDAAAPDAMRRLARHFGTDVTAQRVRAMVPERLRQLGERVDAGAGLTIDQARRLIAADSGYESWDALIEEASQSPTAPLRRPVVVPPPDASGAPVEMRAGFSMRLRDNALVPTADVWAMLIASRDGDLPRVEALLAAQPSLVRCDYNYMPPLHLAVREGRIEIVRLLAERRAVNPKYVTYPYREPLTVVARDRGYDEIAALLDRHSRDSDPNRPEDESGHIEYRIDFERRRFQHLLATNSRSAAAELLRQRPELALDPFTFWSEGVLSKPAHDRRLELIDLLLSFGARVPEMTKWGAFYYFKHTDVAVHLLDRRMHAHHMNCHKTTVLHEMARLGDEEKVRLLLDRGAAIDAVDDEFRSTPLGFAARWGQRDIAALLLARGADPHAAGADWARPLEWARRKGHAAVAALLGG